MLAAALETGQPTPTLLLRALGITCMSAQPGLTRPSQGRSQSSIGINRVGYKWYNKLVQQCSTAIPSEAWPEEMQKNTGISEETFIY